MNYSLSSGSCKNKLAFCSWRISKPEEPRQHWPSALYVATLVPSPVGVVGIRKTLDSGLDLPANWQMEAGRLC